MFDLGWTEMMLIGIVALIVVGPKDLPNMFRALGRFTGKARGMARDFTRAMEQAADDAGVKEINTTLRAAANPRSFAADQIKRASGIPPAGTPLASAAAKPGGATEALAAERAAAREKIEADMQARAIAKREAAAAAPDQPPPQAKEGD
jgi:sec-independent protein translocase protein TatB